MDESRVLGILDMLSNRAREFVHVCEQVLEGEKALQARDGVEPSEWQVATLLSAFINFVGEAERTRYGHFAFDLEKKNNEHKRRDASVVLGRMNVFWNRCDEDLELTEDQQQARDDLFQRFVDNDIKIRTHLRTQPDVYAEGVDQMEHRDWMMRLRILSDTEKKIILEWEDLLERQEKDAQASASA